jgi:hypothetical protein
LLCVLPDLPGLCSIVHLRAVETPHLQTCWSPSHPSATPLSILSTLSTPVQKPKCRPDSPGRTRQGRNPLCQGGEGRAGDGWVKTLKHMCASFICGIMLDITFLPHLLLHSHLGVLSSRKASAPGEFSNCTALLLGDPQVVLVSRIRL